MRMTREQMDELINQHFGFEAADDVDGVLASLFELREGKIAAEQVWCDLAALQRQLNAAALAEAEVCA
jgi:hypothetical protein